ncbi:TlpA family protein disulfide reductase [Marinomonas pollencensis]|uniref:Thioredoxin n=1 Tax=Marinomonas pollencensis TaxID=491954 RepID=A0A3E0DHQ2_9GAMM|nr:hypothetical protein [Marinomonas pollencensis]REG82125.1 hypothetical protein DFP81_11010 [Marinomonas pollencensis]
MEVGLMESASYQVNTVDPADVYQRMALGETFVVNVVTAWCPDCTERQKPHLAAFVKEMASHEVAVLQVRVQLEKGCFISPEDEKLTLQFGGPGYPRTVLVKAGRVVDQDNVEVITPEGLATLAAKFIAQLT